MPLDSGGIAVKKTMPLIVLCGLLSFSIIQEVGAIPVMGSFAGVVETVSGENDLLLEITVGTPFAGVFTYDTDANLLYQFPYEYIYDPSSFHLSLTFYGTTGPSVLHGYDAGGICIGNDAVDGHDFFSIPWIMSWDGSILGYQPDEGSLSLIDSSGTVFNDFSVPNALELQDFDFSSQWVFNSNPPGDGFEISGSFQTLSAGPCTDSDGDGYYHEGGHCGAIDCDDSNPAVNPGATEGPYGDLTCADVLDNDCDTHVDELDTACQECSSAADCDDLNECTNDDCIDGFCTNSYNSAPCDDGDACSMQDTCSEGMCSGIPLDADLDGFVSDACGGNDCDDDDFSVNPGMTEVPSNGKDDDCDLSTPDAPPWGTASTTGLLTEDSSAIVNSLAFLALPFGVVVGLRKGRKRGKGFE